jgi:hypothetical protein
MKLIYLAALLLPFYVKAQNIQCGATTIAVPGLSFKQVCVSLLESGYIIDKKDNDLETVSTQSRHYPKRYSATYIIHARIKDSTAYFTVTFTAPTDGSIVKNEPSIFKYTKKGKPIDNIFTYPFAIVGYFVKGFRRPVEYKAM